MADDARQNQQLRRLLDVTRQMAATLDLTQLLQTIVEAACDVLDCERATIFLYDRKTHELYSRVATGASSIRFPADRGIAGAAATQRAVINVPNAYDDPRFNREIDRQTGFVTRNLLTCALENRAGDLMGVLQALNKRGGPFAADEEELARVLCAQAGVALHRHVLLEEYAAKQRMSRDLELARKIQLAALPKRNPVLPGYEIAGWNQSADETGGDCYDFMELDGGRVALLLADATGHGIGAALVIAQCRSLTRGMLSITDDLPTVAQRVNRTLDHDLTDDRFVTAAIGILDPTQHRLEYVSAGQGPLLFINGAQVEARPAGGLPFAVVDDMPYTVESFDFAPGAIALFLTDGFFEAENAAGEQFGHERVAAFFQAHAATPLEQVITLLHAQLQQHTGRTSQADDLTAVVIRRRA